MDENQISESILRIAIERGPDKSVCPSEVARQLSPEAWRDLMPQVREQAGKLQAAKKIRITQHGRQVEIQTIRGPIRISSAADPPEKSA